MNTENQHNLSALQEHRHRIKIWIKCAIYLFYQIKHIWCNGSLSLEAVKRIIMLTWNQFERGSSYRGLLYKAFFSIIIMNAITWLLQLLTTFRIEISDLTGISFTALTFHPQIIMWLHHWRALWEDKFWNRMMRARRCCILD